MIVFLYRTLIAAAIIFISDMSICGFVATGISVLYLAILVIVRPYLKNIRPILNALVIGFILTTQTVYRLNANMAQAPWITTYLPIIILSLLGLVLIYNIFFMIMHILISKNLLSKKS